MVKRIEPILTVSYLDSMPDDGNRYEIIEGELFVSKAPSLNHQRCLRNCIDEFSEYLKKNQIGEIIPTPGVIFNDINGVIPDLVFIHKNIKNKIANREKIYGAPTLVIEILSPGKENSERDRDVKRQIYGKQGVKEYWVIDLENRIIELYRLKNKKLELYSILGEKDTIKTKLLPKFNCKVTNLFKF